MARGFDLQGPRPHFTWDNNPFSVTATSAAQLLLASLIDWGWLGECECFQPPSPALPVLPHPRDYGDWWTPSQARCVPRISGALITAPASSLT